MSKAKKIVFVITALLCFLLFLNMGAELYTQGDIKQIFGKTPTPEEVIQIDISKFEYESTTTKIVYEQLSEEEKELYDLISKNITSISNHPNDEGFYKIDAIIYEKGELSGHTIYKTVSAFLYENPDVFWLRNVFSYESGSGRTTLGLSSYVSSDERAEMSAKIIEKLSEFIGILKVSEDEYEIEKRVFDYITSNCAYDSSVSSGVENWKAYTIYGALVDKKAVCEGYSKTALKLLNLCGIDSLLVNGYTSDRTAHMWNLVKINEKWYHLDITGCDNDILVNYKYYNLSDSQISKSHILSVQYSASEKVYNGNFILPKAFDESQNYYINEGFYLSGFTTDFEKDLSIEIISAAQKGKDTVHIYVGKNLNFSQSISRIFTDYPYFFSKSLKRAEHASRYSFDSEKVLFVYDEVTRGISVKFLEKKN